ncbi:MAG: hypothetical protein NZ992_00150 [Candidatus Korarchaeum sp.]|nr:hypothetical protein [Candidatus Korarchaeum sp.]MDW8093332.1 hypothetical protein [Nitrososphaerota archaeon]
MLNDLIERAFPTREGKKYKNTRTLHNVVHYLMEKITERPRDEEDLYEKVLSLGYSSSIYLSVRNFLIAYFFPEKCPDPAPLRELLQQENPISVNKIYYTLGMEKWKIARMIYRACIEDGAIRMILDPYDGKMVLKEERK